MLHETEGRLREVDERAIDYEEKLMDRLKEMVGHPRPSFPSSSLI